MDMHQEVAQRMFKLAELTDWLEAAKKDGRIVNYKIEQTVQYDVVTINVTYIPMTPVKQLKLNIELPEAR